MRTKLVRDKIPGLWDDAGRPYTLVQLSELDDQRLREILGAKVTEESREVADALLERDLEHLLEELVDLYDVLRVVRRRLNITQEMMDDAEHQKNSAKGGFTKGYVVTHG